MSEYCCDNQDCGCNCRPSLTVVPDEVPPDATLTTEAVMLAEIYNAVKEQSAKYEEVINLLTVIQENVEPVIQSLQKSPIFKMMGI